MKLGILAKMYYRSAGSHGSPTFTEIPGVSDLSLGVTWDEGEASSKDSPVKKSVKTMLALGITGTLKKKPGNAVYEDIMDAIVSREVLDILILDGAKDEDGSRGWRFDAQIFDASEDQGKDVGAIYTSISIKPTDSDNEPMAVYVSGTSLTYATPGEDTASFT